MNKYVCTNKDWLCGVLHCIIRPPIFTNTVKTTYRTVDALLIWLKPGILIWLKPAYLNLFPIIICRIISEKSNLIER